MSRAALLAATITMVTTIRAGVARAQWAPPMSTAEMTKQAALVVDVHSVGVHCDGAPVADADHVRQGYVTTVAVLKTRKGKGPDTLALHGAVERWEHIPRDWRPPFVLPAGWRGTLYLVDDAGAWRPVAAEGAVASKASKPKPLPSCVP